jgi:hypothetical protein
LFVVGQRFGESAGFELEKLAAHAKKEIKGNKNKTANVIMISL